MFDRYYGSLGYSEMILDICETSRIYIASRRVKSWEGTHYIFNDSAFGGKPLPLGTLLMIFYYMISILMMGLLILLRNTVLVALAAWPNL